MKIPAKFLNIKLTSDELEAAGQLRLAYVLRALIQPIVSLVNAVKTALKKASPAPVITESVRSITVRLPGALLQLSGDERAFYDTEAITAAIAACKTDTDIMDVLEGIGFSCRMIGGKASVMDKTLLDDSEFAFA